MQPPVSKNGYIFESKAWEELNLQIKQLSSVFRQKDPAFIQILNELRMGTLSVQSIQTLKSLDRVQNLPNNQKPTNL